MTALVIDASALVRTLGIGVGPGRFDPYFSSGDERHVPEVFDVEVLSVIRHALLSGLITEAAAGDLFMDQLDAPVRRHRHLPLLPRAYALRQNFTIADAMYVALAERLGAPLVTADERLARAARRHTEVTVLT